MYVIYLAPLLLAIVGISESSAEPLVQLNVYYESLCPDCKQFLTTQLIPNYKKLQSIMSVELVPFGWAKVARVNHTDGTFDVNFTCQHGVQECIGNLIHNCVLNSESIDRSLELFGCMYSSKNYSKPAVAAEE
ncbi:unnamed protein product, partial [Oppiella nova]